MNQYEILYIITAELEEETIRASIDKFKGIVESNGGEIISIDEWGKKKLAYPIDYKTMGYYVLMLFDAKPDFPPELERNMKNDESILRYLVTRRNV